MYPFVYFDDQYVYVCMYRGEAEEIPLKCA